MNSTLGSVVPLAMFISRTFVLMADTHEDEKRFLRHVPISNNQWSRGNFFLQTFNILGVDLCVDVHVPDAKLTFSFGVK